MENGNVCNWIREDILTIPVKDYWDDNANLELVEKSLNRLKEILLENSNKDFYMTKIACGLGFRTWEQVKEIIDRVDLPDNITIVNLDNYFV